MILSKDLFIVCEIPFLEPKFGVKPEKGIPTIISITTTRDEAYKIANKYLEYKNLKRIYSIIFISYYNGDYGEYWGDLFINNNIETILRNLGADIINDNMFTNNCPLYFNNPISNSLNIIMNIKDFRIMVNWIKDGIKNWWNKLNS